MKKYWNPALLCRNSPTISATITVRDAPSHQTCGARLFNFSMLTSIARPNIICHVTEQIGQKYLTVTRWYVFSIPKWSACGVSCDYLKASLRHSFGKTNFQRPRSL